MTSTYYLEEVALHIGMDSYGDLQTRNEQAHPRIVTVRKALRNYIVLRAVVAAERADYQ